MSIKSHCLIDRKGYASLWRWFDKGLVFIDLKIYAFCLTKELKAVQNIWKNETKQKTCAKLLYWLSELGTRVSITAQSLKFYSLVTYCSCTKVPTKSIEQAVWLLATLKNLIYKNWCQYHNFLSSRTAMQIFQHFPWSSSFVDFSILLTIIKCPPFAMEL